MNEKNTLPPKAPIFKLNQEGMVFAYHRFLLETGLKKEEAIMSPFSALVYFGKLPDKHRLRVWLEPEVFKNLALAHGRAVEDLDNITKRMLWDEQIFVYLLQEGEARRKPLTREEACYYDYDLFLNECEEDKTIGDKP